ncbi:MAG: response regulator transcription factor [Clostridia bacterium]|nr:response regulator transcription factor [Clostridia bacterium]
MRILIVEDEIRLAEALGQIMKEEKYVVDIVNDGSEGYYYLTENHYDVVVLDVMLPHMNGYEIVRQMRKDKNATPVILLTARDDTKDKIEGLDAGADDYMTKPFEPEELLARIRALSRRQGEVIIEALTYEDLTLSLNSCTLTCGRKSVHLGFKEFEMLKLFMTSPNILLSKEQMILKIWGYESEVEDNNVEAYISFLRKKISFIGSRVTIMTVRKVGYRLEVL